MQTPAPMNEDLDRYRRKRNFDVTPEPRGDRIETGHRRYVIQKHAARRLHYDLRLEHDGVLWSWAVPKGPSLDPAEKRLAVRTEDHPIDYATFEGTIPAGEYGGGRVLVWDHGQWLPEGDPAEDLERGRLHFRLRGDKLRGRWNLIRIKDDDNWLLIKSHDEYARSEPDVEIVDELPLSVLTGRAIEEIEEVGRKPRDNPEDRDNSRPSRTDENGADENEAQADLPILAPQLAVLVDEVPHGPDWLHELKLDGYRILAYVQPEGVRLRTRGGEDWTERLAGLAGELADPALINSVLDGELCALDGRGIARFELLQQALAERRTGDLVFYAFDLPFAGGEDLRALPLIERKRILRERIESVASRKLLRYCDHVLGMGDKVFASACELGAEGVVSKRIRSIYEGRRTRAWRKVKCPSRMRVHVGGFSAPRGSRQHFGALLVGTYDEQGQLRYRGKVGAGYSDATLALLQPKLEALRQDAPAFVDPPTKAEAKGVTWVAPELVIDVAYGELTESGKLRHGRFEGLHEPEPRRAARAKSSSAIRLTHPDRLLYPERNLSKRDVADYILQVADWMLPHVRSRILTLVRCPDGVGGDCFYQKNAMPGLPESVMRVPVLDSDGDEELIYPSVSDALGLVGLIQMGVIEFHVWGSRIDKIDEPDRLVFDIDPDEGLEFARVITAAVEIRDRLAELGLTSFVKTTGGKGLHVVAPIQRGREFDEVKAFCKAFANAMVSDAPDRYVAVASKVERRGKIFIDYLRNGRGATSIAAYSPRAKPDAPVSTPLRWDELTPALRPASFTVTTIPSRLAELERDPWAGLAELRQSITKASLRAFGLADREA
jgi:bifunctional non-homologous end joining protein LigD